MLAAIIGYVGYAMLWLPSRPLDVSHTQYAIRTGDKFTHRQIDDAIGVMLDRKHHDWHGCRMDRIRYDEAWSNEQLRLEHQMTIDSPGSSSSMSDAIDTYGMDRVVIFQSDFQCPTGGDGSFGTDEQTGWTDTYAYAPSSPKAAHGWVFIDSGY
ncbi:hypothetical protein Uis1B_0768 [Bifidobacterium margollesii]|uniref:Uncharacterized protein n=1 Tax=Bifidobacterium margollesii TaxID=2020964 RepID=A0A2N5JB35_9BIFI|nr:hypothetical protein Uis1B_0768 [Bifidobacterium margollesii]